MPNRHQTATGSIPRLGELVAVGRLLLVDQMVTVVGATGLEPVTSCV